MNALKKRWKGIRVTLLNKIKCPKLFKACIDGEFEEDYPWLSIGTKLHMYLLEPEKFKENYTYLEFETPSSLKQKEFCEKLVESKKTNSIIDEKYTTLAPKIYSKIYTVKGKSEEKIKEEALKLLKSLQKYIEYLTKRKEYKDILNYSTLDFLRKAKLEVGKHIKANELILNFKNNTEHKSELNILWEHPFIELDGEKVVISSTVDRFIIDHENKEIILIDIKTTSDLSNFEESFIKYNYARQMCAYWLALAYYMNQDEKLKKILQEYNNKTYIVAIQTQSNNNQTPIECKVFPVSEATLAEGYSSLTEALNEVVWHFENDKWDHTRQYYENNGLEKTL
jgi:hypothetical protein